MADQYSPGQESVAQTASPNISTVQARNDPNGSVNSLLAALGSESTQAGIANFKQAYDARKLQEQSMKIDGYTQQFMQDHAGGAVSQAQVKARFPETVPVIAARIAESVGKKQGALDFAKIIEQVNADDSLRLDTAKRNAFIANARKEQFSAIGEGNEFYAAGVVSAMDQQVQQQDLKWQAQTAQYHEQVQRTALSDEAVTAFQSADPKAALAAIDARWGQSSSLNNVERNKVYVDAVIKHAAISDDTDLLDRIPQKYLNVDSKAQIHTARLAITNQQWATFNHAKEFEAFQRQEQDRRDQTSILRTIADGGQVNPGQYIRNKEIHDFAVASMSTPTIPEANSQAAVQAFRTSLMAAANVGSVGSQADITKQVFGLRGRINPKDMAALVEEVPKLMEGSVLMNDPSVREAFRDHIGSRLDDLKASATGRLSLLLGQGNLRGQSVDLYEGEVRAGFQAYYQDNGGVWPKGREARNIVDAAVAKTSTWMDRKISILSLTDERATTPTATTRPAASTAPAAPVGLPKGVTQAAPLPSNAAPLVPARVQPAGLPKGVTLMQ